MLAIPKFQVTNKQRRGKRYESLLVFQDQTLSKTELKKIDRALRRKNARRNILSREARKALELGKDLGIQIQGDEEELQNFLGTRTVVKALVVRIVPVFFRLQYSFKNQRRS
ncbi:hypothetical protein V6N13_015067 [Hibiscus sabdariffa]